VLRASIDPAMTSGTWGGQLAAGNRVAAFRESLRPRSAAAELIARGLSVDLSGVGSATLPGIGTAYPEPSWIAEGAPINAQKPSLTAATLTPKKLATISGLTGELADYSAEDAEAIITDMMEDAVARALDASVFSAAAASATRPAGILNGVTAVTASTAGGLGALVADAGALAEPIHAAGGGSSIVFFAAPAQAVAIKLLAGSTFDFPVITAASLAAGTVVAVEARAFASGFSDVPRVDIAKEAVVHWDDSAPAAIGTAGSPNTVAAPVRSGFQTYTYAIRCVLRAAWAMRGTGFVQFVEGADYA